MLKDTPLKAFSCLENVKPQRNKFEKNSLQSKFYKNKLLCIVRIKVVYKPHKKEFALF